MELALTKSQKRYLNKKGAISASSLQKAYTNSVKEQQSVKKAANKLRKKKSSN